MKVSDLAEYSRTHSLLLACLDEKTSASIAGSRNGPARFSFTVRHGVLDNLKPPCLCLFFLNDGENVSAYMGVVVSKRAVTTLDSAVNISSAQPVRPTRPEKLLALLSKRAYKTRFEQEVGAVSVLPQGLSKEVVTRLAAIEGNTPALRRLAAHLFGEERLPRRGQEQNDAIQLALKVFGLDKQALAAKIDSPAGSDSSLQFYETRISEDNLIAHDARAVPGYDLIESSSTGHAVFLQGDDRLDIYTANRGPLEKMLGVDLVYVNVTQQNVVMVQYKMLEKEDSKANGASPAWVYRPDRQFSDEVGRMRRLRRAAASTEYRLNQEPFYFKFAKRYQVAAQGGILLPLEHLDVFLGSAEAKGARGGVRVSYEALRGRYLRETEFLAMIRSGYIGTTPDQTRFLLPLIESVIRGGNALVYAVQQKLQGDDEHRADV